MDEIAITVNDVSKDFRLPHEKTSSIKNLFVHALGYIRKRRSYEVQHALKDISFEIKKGEFFGIVGRNGSGKSTLLKILAGIYQPTKGSLHVNGKLVPFIELGVGFNPELTGRENVYLSAALMGFNKKQTDAKYKGVVEFAELEDFMDQKLKNYSSGMQVRLAFSLAIKAEADVLLIDEVLAVGDADFQRKCFEYFKNLKKNNKTVVFVTHDMNAIREFCDRGVLIDNSELSFKGKANDVAREYSLLFLKNSGDGAAVSKDKKRWGNGAAQFSEITLKLVNNTIQVEAVAQINQKIDRMLYGIHVFSQDGSEITATNNRMIGREDVKGLLPGTAIKFSWEMLNIFNDGIYFITLTLADDENNNLDWYNEAATFKVKRIERSTTAVIPPISVSSKLVPVDKGKK